ncbi:23S rRNA (adenine(1618)-N(6))-methyltransferase RlmF [Aliagarivorans taiwanensis]|uniref:23S rRNA (adenine(1618)-N(6))-methyltransferase RlmF n=1 Tax=Aliagarivorans taiwanensis TaxID=561966 RepID=UPI000415FABC|nr:23S rRNA (adenine(1618)-N(6))-methyltransferase RlmF [Aliagarivorans taiwanensis]
MPQPPRKPASRAGKPRSESRSNDVWGDKAQRGQAAKSKAANKAKSAAKPKSADKANPAVKPKANAVAKPKASLHPRNPHQGRYDFARLIEVHPPLHDFVRANPKGDNTIDFADPAAVLCLNQALLASHYGVGLWQLPPGYLCPPIPGRADYIHHLADLLGGGAKPPEGKQVRILDVGTGASVIYPILGAHSYGWQFVASDIDPVSVSCAQTIVQSNPGLKGLVKVKQQNDPEQIFAGIIGRDQFFAATMCNPPFHASLEEALQANQRKRQNLAAAKGESVAETSPEQSKLNFGGQKAELWCPGGEIQFLSKMLKESTHFAQQVGWFTSLVSKSSNLKALEKLARQLKVKKTKVIAMGQGQKQSRLFAWRF